MTEPLKAVIFDWAGTMIDFGSRAPVVALCQTFAARNVPIEEAEARADMGRAKRDHIAALLARPRIAAAWTAAHGAAPTAADVDALFDAVGDAMRSAARDCAILIPGAAQVAQALQATGVKLGSCTGYSRDMMVDIIPAAAAQGYRPDYVVCAGETAEGRPSPLMAWKNLIELGVWPARAAVKVDDAPVGIAEGRNAGLWAIGIAASGNGVGLTEAELAALPESDRAARIATARDLLLEAGAHDVIATVADLPAALGRMGF